MKLKLQESPREWLKFTAVIGTMVALAGWLLQKRGWLPGELWMVFIPGVIAVSLCAMRPQWFRGFYRGGMTVFFHIGQFMGRMLLTIFFFLAVTPLGLILRLMGKDLLQLKRDPKATTYWQSPRKSGGFDRQF